MKVRELLKILADADMESDVVIRSADGDDFAHIEEADEAYGYSSFKVFLQPSTALSPTYEVEALQETQDELVGLLKEALELGWDDEVEGATGSAYEELAEWAQRVRELIGVPKRTING